MLINIRVLCKVRNLSISLATISLLRMTPVPLKEWLGISDPPELKSAQRIVKHDALGYAHFPQKALIRKQAEPVMPPHSSSIW
jgi:hypothetical protein